MRLSSGESLVQTQTCKHTNTHTYKHTNTETHTHSTDRPTYKLLLLYCRLTQCPPPDSSSPSSIPLASNPSFLQHASFPSFRGEQQRRLVLWQRAAAVYFRRMLGRSF